MLIVDVQPRTDADGVILDDLPGPGANGVIIEDQPGSDADGMIGGSQPGAGSDAVTRALWLRVLRRALLANGQFRCALIGDSMEPTLPVGCAIVIARLPERVALGQIVAFVDGDALVAHRLVRRSGEHWIAQGDNRPWPDPPRHRAQALGVVVRAEAAGGRCWPTPFSGIAAGWWLMRHQLWRARQPLRRAYGRVRRTGRVGRDRGVGRVEGGR